LQDAGGLDKIIKRVIKYKKIEIFFYILDGLCGTTYSIEPNKYYLPI
jgi:hypothetical protein